MLRLQLPHSYTDIGSMSTTLLFDALRRIVRTYIILLYVKEEFGNRIVFIGPIGKEYVT